MVAALLLLGGAGAGLGGYLLSRPPAESRAEAPPTDSWNADEEPASAVPAPAPTASAVPATTPSDGPGRHAVVYEVTGQGKAAVLYVDANGERIWLDSVQLPWRLSIRTDRRAEVMVQISKIAGTGPRVACSVTIDGGRPATERSGPDGWRASCFG